VDRGNLSDLYRLWLHGPLDLGIADTIGEILSRPERTPLDRRRGAAFRLVALLAAGRPDDAIAAWTAVDLPRTMDPWVIQAYLAGHPAVDSLARPMLAAARAAVEERGSALVALPIWDEAQQAVSAAAHDAALHGDSAEVRSLLRVLDSAPDVEPTNPVPAGLAAGLRARLAFLAGDTTEAIRELRAAVARIQEPATWYYPLTSMAPQRRLLADLLRARDQQAESARWRDSFVQSWSPGDLLFAHPPRR